MPGRVAEAIATPVPYGLRVDADRMEALIDGLSLVPALTSLDFCDCDLSSSAEPLMETLATTCMHLETLHVWGWDALTRREVVAVLSGTLNLPRLTSLSMVILLSPMLDVLPELVAAGRHLRTLHLETIYEKPGGVGEGKRALCRALALLQNAPFFMDALPEDTDGFVVLPELANAGHPLGAYP
ncbi:hypothetical protein SPRG_14617 [Saprolegnia parasitica CBS 223.65]|uniref:F-box domain-containing protein n=1 Tax=Saprolegnia parasitica (strain CBS 223.65) TaxID=695850 RepID=A0A067BPF5_SAPPC|nr:hypothetical protein SPRG_14617 [Saprolegnia parasitica CBS 223.65]KDO20138.1 hypothetical protein SPRG_14617 [Saprolegnia parasitica CBS 223.65]|eukprot:XP_012209179.1 hypothetical protein SPRG_14617 [Saprolegnia parasitica CBS 223.65]